ncbi:MAG: tail fiber protein [Kiloniellales bacterium]|nr:tail fiber protein [Kiloniellales bacterium]
MADPFIGEIRIFAGDFAPRDWALCNGQVIPIEQNPALFSLVGAIYGGDGRNDFGVPNLPGRAPMHAGTGSGLTPRRIGQTGGTTIETLATGQMPSHSHQLEGSTEDDNETSPENNYTGALNTKYAPAANLVNMAGGALPSVGGGQSHTNLQPLLVMNFIIALNGIIPVQS